MSPPQNKSPAVQPGDRGDTRTRRGICGLALPGGATGPRQPPGRSLPGPLFGSLFLCPSDLAGSGQAPVLLVCCRFRLLHPPLTGVRHGLWSCTGSSRTGPGWRDAWPPSLGSVGAGARPPRPGGGFRVPAEPHQPDARLHELGLGCTASTCCCPRPVFSPSWMLSQNHKKPLLLKSIKQESAGGGRRHTGRPPGGALAPPAHSRVAPGALGPRRPAWWGRGAGRGGDAGTESALSFH